MKTIIAGSRSCDRYCELEWGMRSCPWVPTLVLSGAARGADKLGEMWAQRNGVPLIRYPADWERFGHRAGLVRNAVMAFEADALIALWDGKSNGTRHMIDTARRMGLAIHVIR